MEENTLEELINEARVRGLWLHCDYQNLWFSPEELEEQNANGKFRWGSNFKVENPYKEIERLKLLVIQAENEQISFSNRVRRSE